MYGHRCLVSLKGRPSLPSSTFGGWDVRLMTLLKMAFLAMALLPLVALAVLVLIVLRSAGVTPWSPSWTTLLQVPGSLLWTSLAVIAVMRLCRIVRPFLRFLRYL